MKNLLTLKRRKKTKTNLFISFGSLISLAAINYTLIHSPYVFLLTFILLVHELGHYFVAKKYAAYVDYPVFLPIPYIAIAFTRIKDLPDHRKAITALAGILFSVSFILNLILHNYIYNIISYYFLFTILFTEIIFNYFGIDGSKYRKFRQKTTQI